MVNLNPVLFPVLQIDKKLYEFTSVSSLLKQRIIHEKLLYS